METFLLNFSGDLYEKDAEIFFYKYLRPEIQFDSTDALTVQINKDIQLAGEYFGKVGIE